ncbi:hypothetical protein LCGC14_2728160 [marine sediment metagenome]|uniref:Nuclease associated modular domain-containing protein n=1 Tax=marine sediment metagenome TaxID=412755 RepID=A0A0F9BZU5_9ZZZZ
MANEESEVHKLSIKVSYTVDLSEVRRQAMLKRYSDPKERELQSQCMKLVMNSPKTKIRISEGQKKKTKNPLHWAKMHDARRGSKASKETKEKMRLVKLGNTFHLGHNHSQETIEKMRAVKLGKVMSRETRLKMSRTGKRLWRLSSHRDKLVSTSRKAMSIHPNKPESIVLELLNIIAPNEWAFVGDGQVIIEGKIPDFININGQKKIIEVFGDYWHGERARCYEKTEEGRKRLFKKYGYLTLIIWENELKDVDRVRDKIKEFVGG